MRRSARFRFRDQLWSAWPWAGSILPVILALSLFWTVAEMPSLGLLMMSVVLLGGALGVLPRVLLRRRANGAIPAPLAPVLVVHWWCWVTFIFIQFTTSARIYSAIPLLQPLGQPIYESLATTLIGLTFSGWVITVLLLWVMAVFLRQETRFETAWRGATLGVGVGVPALLIAISVSTQLTVQGQLDAAGDTVTTAQARSFDERARLVQERYESVQQDVSEMRGLIDPEARWTSEPVFINQATSFDRSGAESYELWLEFGLDYSPTAEQVDEVVRYLERQEWDVIDAKVAAEPNELWAEHPDGGRLRILNDNRGESSTLDFISPRWWTGDDDGSFGAACPAATLSDFFSVEFQRSADDGDDALPPALYAADDWPDC